MKVYSNEIVFRGHPDKVCDQISDAILDECLRHDKTSRCGIEVMGGKGKIFITSCPIKDHAVAFETVFLLFSLFKNILIYLWQVLEL